MKRVLDIASWPAGIYLVLSALTCPHVLFGAVLFFGIWIAWKYA